MPKVTYVASDGSSQDIEVPLGENVMRGALYNGVDGIVGECGGSCACATCHCYVGEGIGLAPPEDGELAMLENVAAERRPDSRLACQLKASPALAGLVLTLPDRQE